MDMDIKEHIKEELEGTREEYHRLLTSISEEDFLLPSANPAWSVAEILSHMSLAPRYISSDIVFIRRFAWIPKPPAVLFHTFNNWSTKRGARNATHDSLAEHYDVAHVRMIEALENIQDDEWTKGAEYPGWDPMLSGFVTLERLFRYPNEHFQAHKKELEVVLGDASSADNRNGGSDEK